MDVLLVNPPIYLGATAAAARRRSDPLSYDQPPIHFPPIGLAYLGAALERAGFGVAILDAWERELEVDAILAEIAHAAPRVVGLSVLVFTLPSVYTLVHAIRDRFPDVAVVLGNMQVADDPDVVRKMAAHYGVVGWGEEPLVRLTRLLVRDEGDPATIPGLVWEDGGAWRTNPPWSLDDPDALPLPARHLFGDRIYYSPADARPMTMLSTIRGCPFRCGHCHHSSAHVRDCFPFRQRSVEGVVDELAWIAAHTPVEYVEFTDDTFTSNRRRVLAFCAQKTARGIDLEWGSDSRANLLDRALLEAMRAAGCKKLSVGVETANEAARVAMEKRVTNAEVRETIRNCREVGIETTANFMFGLPGETVADLEASIGFALELKPSYVEFHIALVLPNTPLFQDAVARGLIEPDVYDRFMRGEAPFPVFVPEGLTLDDLTSRDSDAYRRFYLRPGYVVERLRRIRSAAELKRHIRMGLWLLKTAWGR